MSTVSFQGPSRPALSVIFGAAIALGLLLGATHADREERARFARASAGVLVRPPETAPPVSQESIDLALMFFGIQVPDDAEHPRLDTRLADRGLTVRGALLAKAQVTIGLPAFESWALLGSTLAHELEVHCKQKYLAIWALDRLGMDGTGAAERQAYAHELRNAWRFGLRIEDADLIADTMEYYYPEDPKGQGPIQTVRRWAARNFLRGQRF